MSGTDALTGPFPPLPLEEWEDAKNTLHRFAQIIGKIRLASMPHHNHWWQVPLYVTTRGLTTRPMPHGDETFAIDFDFIDHRLNITTSTGAIETFPVDNLSVARFYEQVFSALSRIGIDVTISPIPYELEPATPFPSDTGHSAYDREYVNRYWRILTQVDMALKEFSGRFTGKTSPVHLFWHSFDLAITRFSYRRAPDRDGADHVTREAYSHEVISFGFWAGDATVRAPAFYSYTAPEPAGLSDQPLRPESAFWNTSGGGSTALLMYDDLRATTEPKTALLDFLESAYQAGATTAGWDEEALRTIKLDRGQ